MKTEMISTAALHAPVFGSEATQIGGAEEATREFGQWLQYNNRLRMLATVRYSGLRDRFPPIKYGLPQASIAFTEIPHTMKGDILLQDDRTMVAFQNVLAEAASKADIMFNHYYIAGGAWDQTKKGDSPVEVFMAHTWGESVKVNNPMRNGTSPLRQAIETGKIQNIVDGKLLLAIQTRAEAEQLLDLYGIENPTDRKSFMERAIICPLGVPPDFLLTGLNIIDRQMEKEQAKYISRVRFAYLLEKEGKVDEAKRILNFPLSTKLMYVIGRLEPGKGHEEALEGFVNAMQKERRLNAALLLVGGDFYNNPVYERLNRRMHELPSDIAERVLLLGNQLDTNVMPACDVGIVPSRRESFSFVGAKTMAVGNGLIINRDPIIMEAMGFDSDIPGAQRMPDPLTFDPDNPEELGDAIIRMATDDELLFWQSYRNVLYADSITWERTTRRFLDQLDAKIGSVK